MYLIVEKWQLLGRLRRLPAYFHYHHRNVSNGRAIAQAVSRWLPTAAARVETRV
jgi:hypothetical protein